jgi:hypothetical protein
MEICPFGHGNVCYQWFFVSENPVARTWKFVLSDMEIKVKVPVGRLE